MQGRLSEGVQCEGKAKPVGRALQAGAITINNELSRPVALRGLYYKLGANARRLAGDKRKPGARRCHAQGQKPAARLPSGWTSTGVILGLAFSVSGNCWVDLPSASRMST